MLGGRQGKPTLRKWMSLSEKVAAQKMRKGKRLVDKHKLRSVKGTKQAGKATVLP